MPRIRMTIDFREEIPGHVLMWTVKRVIETLGSATQHATVRFERIDDDPSDERRTIP